MKPRIAIPLPTSFDPEYNDRAWPQYAQAIEQAGGEPVPIPLDQPSPVTTQVVESCSAVLLPGSGADIDPRRYGAAPDPHSAAPDPAREQTDQLLLDHAQNRRKPVFTICFGTQMLNVWRGGTLIQDLPTAQPGSPVNHKAGRTIPEAHAAEIAPDSLLGQILAPAIANRVPRPNSVRAGLEPHSFEEPQNRVPRPNSVRAGLEPHSFEEPQNRVPRPNSVRAGLEPPNSEEPTGQTPPLHLIVNSSHHQAIETPGRSLRVVARSPEDGVIEAIEGPETGSFLLGVQWHPERTCDSSAASRALFARFLGEARAWAAAHEPKLP